jgi:hypothetical protein
MIMVHPLFSGMRRAPLRVDRQSHAALGVILAPLEETLRFARRTPG